MIYVTTDYIYLLFSFYIPIHLQEIQVCKPGGTQKGAGVFTLDKLQLFVKNSIYSYYENI